MLRIVLGANALGVTAALLLSPTLGRWLPTCLELAYRVQLPVLLCLLLFAAAEPLLRRLPRWAAAPTVLVAVAGIVVVSEDFWRFFGFVERPSTLRSVLLAGFASGLLLIYFDLRQRGADPAANAARLAALTARIRPHFLFNSLNAVLSLIRSEPRRAERALETLADLFRVLMRDPHDLAPLSAEIELCRQYLDLEKLRLGERLRVEWAIAEIPEDAMVPPLVLQPLLENAVYHGIEPAADGGLLQIGFARRDGSLVIDIANPLAPPPSNGERGDERGGGNRMALANIRERLVLHYDLEARLETQVAGGTYRVRIELPYRHGD